MKHSLFSVNGIFAREHRCLFANESTNTPVDVFENTLEKNGSKKGVLENIDGTSIDDTEYEKGIAAIKKYAEKAIRAAYVSAYGDGDYDEKVDQFMADTIALIPSGADKSALDGAFQSYLSVFKNFDNTQKSSSTESDDGQLTETHMLENANNLTTLPPDIVIPDGFEINFTEVPPAIYYTIDGQQYRTKFPAGIKNILQISDSKNPVGFVVLDGDGDTSRFQAEGKKLAVSTVESADEERHHFGFETKWEVGENGKKLKYGNWLTNMWTEPDGKVNTKTEVEALRDAKYEIMMKALKDTNKTPSRKAREFLADSDDFDFKDQKSKKEFYDAVKKLPEEKRKKWNIPEKKKEEKTQNQKSQKTDTPSSEATDSQKPVSNAPEKESGAVETNDLNDAWKAVVNAYIKKNNGNQMLRDDVVVTYNLEHNQIHISGVISETEKEQIFTKEYFLDQKKKTIAEKKAGRKVIESGFIKTKASDDIDNGAIVSAALQKTQAAKRALKQKKKKQPRRNDVSVEKKTTKTLDEFLLSKIGEKYEYKKMDCILLTKIAVDAGVNIPGFREWYTKSTLKIYSEYFKTQKIKSVSRNNFTPDEKKEYLVAFDGDRTSHGGFISFKNNKWVFTHASTNAFTDPNGNKHLLDQSDEYKKNVDNGKVNSSAIEKARNAKRIMVRKNENGNITPGGYDFKEEDVGHWFLIKTEKNTPIMIRFNGKQIKINLDKWPIGEVVEQDFNKYLDSNPKFAQHIYAIEISK